MNNSWILEFDDVVYGYVCSRKPATQNLSLKIPAGKRWDWLALRQQIGLVFQNPEHQLVAWTVEEDISGVADSGDEEISLRNENLIIQKTS